MMIINSASPGGISYWQGTAASTQWMGHGAQELGLVGPVGHQDLQQALLGRSPAGEPLTSRPRMRRRHGWDLVFVAPKSLSLLATRATPEVCEPLRGAFWSAVADSVDLLETRAAWASKGGELVQAPNIVAAAFLHLANDMGEPHLHAHVVLANLAMPQRASTSLQAARPGREEPEGASPGYRGSWACLAGNEIWRWREALGPGFQLALRDRACKAGFNFEWDLRPGAGGEIRGVAAADRSASSMRSVAVLASARRSGTVSSGALRAAQARTRGTQRTGPPPPPLERLESLARQARRLPAVPGPPPSAPSVDRALAERASTHTEPGVLAAIAETSPKGLPLTEAARIAARWCPGAACEPGPGAARARPGRTGRWSTGLARQLDDHVVARALGSRPAGTARVAPELAWAELEALGFDTQTARVACHIVCSGEGVSVVGPGPWLNQATCIDAARAAWQAGGVGVRVAAPTELSAMRWRALTSLLPRSPAAPDLDTADRAATDLAGTNLAGEPWDEGPGRRALIVDAASNLSPAALARLVDQAAASRTKLVLVCGGTVPRRGPSAALSLDKLAEALEIPGWQALRDRPARIAAEHRPYLQISGIGARGCFTGKDAMANLAATYRGLALLSAGHAEHQPGHKSTPAGQNLPEQAGGPGEVMVAYGPDEVEALNEAARRAFFGGTVPPRQVAIGKRSYAVGDRVLALRRIGKVLSATPGTVVEVGDRSVRAQWGAASGALLTEVGPEQAKSLGYGYATTLPYLRGFGLSDLLVLGDPTYLGQREARVASAWLAVAGPGALAHGLAGAHARRQAGLVELATGWPDQELLRRAGDKPLEPAARRRWVASITACLAERSTTLESQVLPGLPQHRREERVLVPGRRPGHPGLSPGM